MGAIPYIEKLPYLGDLGINAIQIMPPMEFAGGFSWGYNPAHDWRLAQTNTAPRLRRIGQRCMRLMDRLNFI